MGVEMLSSVSRLIPADLVMVNGKVITVDTNFSIKQAVAVKGDKIIVAGMNEEVSPFIGKQTVVLDLKGKTVLPGINDSHLHAALFGGTRPPLALDVGYPTVKSISDIVKAISQKVEKTKPGEWIRGLGWDVGYLEECLKDPGRYPTRWDLDLVSPDNPVLLNDYSQHELWVNSKVLELAGITGDTQLPSGGEIVKDASTGEPTGILRELPAEGLVMKVVPTWNREQKRQAILSMMSELNSLGITSITEGALGPGGAGFQGGLSDAECISIYNDLHNEGELTLRVGFLYLFGEYGSCCLKDLQQTIPYLGVHSGFGNDMLRIAGIKLFADGVPTGKTAWMYEDYPDGGNGHLVLPGDTDEERRNELTKMIIYAHQHGFQVGIHAIGGRAIEACIEGFIQAEREEPKGLRHYVIHGDFISDKYAKLAAEYDIGNCVQPIIKWTTSDIMDKLVGIELSAREWPLRTLVDIGVHLSAGSDAPVTYPSWLQGVQAAVLRESKATGTIRGPEQCITVAEAIRMYTIEGAWQDHMEHIKGSIEVGKLADFCILDKDILTVEPHSIKDIRNLMTIVAGKIVYDTGTI
jgi:predicted amidohydrolase YtcJ